VRDVWVLQAEECSARGWRQGNAPSGTLPALPPKWSEFYSLESTTLFFLPCKRSSFRKHCDKLHKIHTALGKL